MTAEAKQCPTEDLLALFAKLPPGPFWWEQCYELDGVNWAICDATNKAERRVTCGYMVLHADYDKCCDGRPLSEQDLPKAVIESLNAVPGLIQEIAALTARVAELEGERERLREALLAADRDISEWLQLAKRQANELPNADYHPLAPTRLGIAASNEVRELIKSVFHVNIHGEVEYRET
jgi:hypothetical protein